MSETNKSPKKNIDLHVLHMDGEINLLGNFTHPLVDVHHLPGFPGSPLVGRIQAFQMGTRPYVSFADPDDEVRGEAFECCTRILDNTPEIGAVYTNSTVVNETTGISRPMFFDHEWSIKYHLSKTTPVHQLVVMRREVVMEACAMIEREFRANDYLTLGEQLLYSYIAKIKPWHFLNVDGYTWYKRETGIHAATVADNQIQLANFKKELFSR